MQDLESELQQLSGKVESSLDFIKSEEHTKMAFIVPFIAALGYDIFNPLEVVPEYTCDFGTKKGEKVDYCIMNGQQPYILIECKDCRNKLTQENISQLFRYYSVSSAKLAILTNGIEYMLFTDSIETNKMDTEPFYKFTIRNLSSNDIYVIKMLLKENINNTSIVAYSKISLFKAEVDNWVESEKNGLSRDFINFLKKKLQTYDLPNEEISKVVVEKLFNVSCSTPNTDSSITSEVKEKGKKLAKGTDGVFNFSDADILTAITGSKVDNFVIDNKNQDVSKILDILLRTIDYILDELGCSTDKFISVCKEGNISNFSLESSSKDIKEYRGLYFRHGISAANAIQLSIKLCTVFNIDLDKCVVTMHSRG